MARAVRRLTRAVNRSAVASVPPYNPAVRCRFLPVPAWATTRSLRALGAGGMGEVYLARDTTLDRMVALKLLPADVTSDAHRVARFEREARSASSLSHPNICVIHALGAADDGRRFIAMEYVEGSTLRERLSPEHGPAALREVLDIGIQIAAGVGAAHALGIVHRDLKPENVIVRADGLVKVLDFGLAKLAPPDPLGPTLDDPTRAHVVHRGRHRSSARWCTCRRSRFAGSRSTAARTSGVSASCSTS